MERSAPRQWNAAGVPEYAQPMALRRAVVCGSALLVASACSLFTSLDDLEGEKAGGDGGGPDAASAAVPVDAGGGPPADAGDVCPTGAALEPVELTTAGIADSGAVACNGSSAAALDGKVAALDKAYGKVGLLAGQQVGGCVGARFARPIRSFVTHVISLVGDTCGGFPCNEGCTSPLRYKAFAGPSLASLTYLDLQAPGDAGFVETLVQPSTTWVVVCRGSWDQGPDVGVDAIVGTCL